VANECVVNADYASVPVGVGIRVIFLRKNHDVRMCTRIQRVLFSPHVVGRIVDAENFMLVYLILDEGNGCSLRLSEYNLVGVMFHIEDLTESVVFEVGDEILKRSNKLLVDSYEN